MVTLMGSTKSGQIYRDRKQNGSGRGLRVGAAQGVIAFHDCEIPVWEDEISSGDGRW